MTDLAPIGLSTYKRLDHLKQTIAALAQNALAKDSQLFVFSDGARPGDEAPVAEVRRFLRGIQGFRSITIIERPTNARTFNNRDGLRQLLAEFGRVIYLEEDIVTSPLFLKFMNSALDHYEDDEQAFSISGYSPPIKIPASYEHDVFSLLRFCAWGFGIWKDRFDRIDLSLSGYENFISDRKLVKEFCRNGEDMLIMLSRSATGEIDALDAKAMYSQFLSQQYTIYPRQSLTQNIGHDGTGTYCGVTRGFDVKLYDGAREFRLKKPIPPDARLIRANFHFRRSMRPGRARRLARSIVAPFRRLRSAR